MPSSGAKCPVPSSAPSLSERLAQAAGLSSQRNSAAYRDDVVAWAALALCSDPALLFLALTSFWANSSAHLGQLHRALYCCGRTLADGRSSVARPPTLNSNHVFSNWIVFHLQRHSDHHAHPTRRYQSPRHFENPPELPNGLAAAITFGQLPSAAVVCP